MNQTNESSLLDSLYLKQQAFDCAPASIFIIDPQVLMFVDANETALQSLGYTREELLQLKVEDVDATFTSEMISTAFDSIINSKEGQGAFPTSHRRKDNTTFEVEVQLRRCQQNNQNYILASTTGKSFFKKATEELEIHAKLTALIPDAIVTTNENFLITNFNQPAADLFKWKAEEVLGRSTKDVTSSIYPNSSSAEVAAQLFKNGYWHGEIITHKKDGTGFPAFISVSTLKAENGETTGTVSVIRDLTLQKRQEKELEYLAGLVDKVSDAIISVDEHYNIVSWNKAAETIYGFTKEEVAGKYIMQVWGRADLHDFKNHLINVFEKNKSWYGELKHYDKSFAEKWCLISASPLNDEAGSLTGYALVVKDITERKRLEEELKELNESLEKKVSEKTRELNNIFERITDGVVAFDKHWNYTYANKKGAEAVSSSPELLIGKNVWQLFPQMVGSSLHTNYLKAAGEQKVIRTVEYVDQFEKWFEGVMYPSPDGLVAYFQDVTDKKNAEIARDKSQELYRTIVETAQEGIWQLDENNNTSFVNNFLSQLLGYTEEEMHGQPLFEFMDEEAKQEAVYMMGKRKQGISEQHEFRFQKKDGTPLHTLLQSSPIFKEGEYVGALAMVLDVSERKKWEEELVAKEKRFRSLFTNSSDGITLMAADGIVLDLSYSFETIFGYSREEVIGTRRVDMIVPEYVPLILETVEAVKRDPFEIRTIEFEAIKRDGTRIWIECSYKNLLNEPSVNALVQNFRDITERKEAEKRNTFKAHLLNTISQSVIATDLTGTIIYWNKAATKIYGWEADETIGKNIVDIVPAEQSKEQGREIMEALRNGHSWAGEFEVCRKDGSCFSAFVTDSPIYDQQGELSGVIGVSTDITERKRIERELRESEERYKKAQVMGKLGHWEMDLGSNQLYWSDQIYSILKINPATTVPNYNTFIGFIHPEDRDRVEKDLNSVLTGQQDYNTTHRVLLEGDEIRYFHGLGELVKDKNGQAVKLAGTIQDITEQKLSEEKLKESGEQLSLIFNSSVNGMALFTVEENSDLRFEAINDSLCNRINVERDKVIGHLFQDVFGFPAIQHLQPGYNEAIRTGLLQRITAVSQRGSGNRTIEHTVVPIKNSAGKVGRLLSVSNDITEQQEAEQKLLQSEEKYRLLFEKSPLPMWIFDTQTFHFLEVNPAAIQHYGYSRHQFLQMTLHDVRPGKSNPIIEDISDFNNHKTYNVSSVHQKKNGELIKVQVSVSNIRYENKKARLVLLIDRTEQELAKEKLLKSEENYRLLFEKNPVPLNMFQCDTLEFVDVNEASVSLYGYSKEEFLKLNVMELRPQEDLPNGDFLYRRNCDKGFNGIVRHLKKNGEIIWVKITTNRIVYDNKEIWLEAGRDITNEIFFAEQLKERQQQLSVIFNNTIDGMWLLKVEGENNYRFESINDACANITGIKREEAIGKPFREIVPPELFQQLEGKYDKAVTTGKTETFFITAFFGGSEIVAQVTIIPIKDEKGEVHHLLGIANDVTEQQEARKELLKINVQLRELASHLQNIREEERANMAREIHDELGQQLTGIKMDIAWLSRKLVAADTTITDRVKALLSLIDGTINTVRKIASELRPSVLDELGLAEAIDWQSSEFTKRTKIQVKFYSHLHDTKFSPGISITIFRIFQEALTNVARHSGATKVECSLVRNAETLLLNITDNGKGFDTKEQTVRKTLGLLGMKERVVMLNGQYRIDSSPGTGTTLSVEIPLNKA